MKMVKPGIAASEPVIAGSHAAAIALRTGTRPVRAQRVDHRGETRECSAQG
ncbi:MAG: hypothetical protein IPN75_01390 [Dechloromonas sp.]|uniref:Uncharacterized protein n=1 Tax=Candidatus Dechloromonas phosphorivorans TaxID=2899244 RepID=A0A9D7QJ63_9RHOO|nr:hypothetical protein [Candidatus Dechloromonas phosphorivorans]